jgi:subtilisin
MFVGGIMKKIILIFLIVSLFYSIPSNSHVSATNKTINQEFIVVTDSQNQAQLQRFLLERNIEIIDSFNIEQLYFSLINTNEFVIDELQKSKFVLTIDKNHLVSATENIQSLNTQIIPWGIQAVEADRFKTRNCNCKIAIIDTGISDHDELNYSVVAKATFINGKEYYNQAIDDDIENHGTHVAGIIAAKNDSDGIVGLVDAPKLYIAKVLDKYGNGYISDITKAVQWAINQKVDIINLSLGSPEFSPILEIVLKDAYNKGIIIVAAAGNDGMQVNYPARSPYTIAVGAADQNRYMPNWSSFGKELDILAPGVDIISTVSNNRFKKLSGTSMAAPHVTGIIANLLPLYNGKNNSHKVEWMRNRIRSYANFSFDKSGKKLNSIGFANLYRSYYEIPYLQNIFVKDKSSNNYMITNSQLVEYKDSYNRIKVMLYNKVQEFQLTDQSQ